MARARSSGNGRLEESMTVLQQSMVALNQSTAALNQSMATLNQAHAAFVARMAEMDRELIEIKRETAERFARIEATLADHSRILAEMWRYLQALPEAVREKIGFKPPQ